MGRYKETPQKRLNKLYVAMLQKIMGPISGIVVYLCTWWLVIFCVLPWGGEPHAEEGHGTAGSAPKDPKLRQKFMITTLISAVIWCIIFIIIEIAPISFWEQAKIMAENDG